MASRHALPAPRGVPGSASVTRRISARVLAAAACLALLLSLAPGTATAEPVRTIAGVQATLTGLEHDAEAAGERAHDARAEADVVRQQLDKVRADVAARGSELEALRGDAGRLAAARYRSGRIDPALALVFSDDPAAFLAGAASLDQLAQRRSTTLRRVATAQNRLAQSRLELAARSGQLGELTARLDAEEATLRAKVREAEQLLASLKEAERRRLEAARIAAEQRAAAAAAAAARASRDTRSAAGTGGGNGTDAGSGDDSGSGSGGAPEAPPADVPVSGRAGVAVATALAQVGDRYVYAGNGPDVFDCSGLTSFAWRAAGVSLPRSSKSQYAAGRKVSRGELQPGDLLYFYSPISHVGIYVGGGMMVHASNPRTGVKHVAVYWDDFVGATRP